MGSVAQKIRRALELRRLARSTSAGPERAAALRAAQAIMRKYGIGERELLIEEKVLAAETHEEVTVLANQHEQELLWRRALVQTIVKVFGLVAHHESKGLRRIYVVGMPEVRTLAAADVKKIAEAMTTAAKPRASKKADHTAFLEGCALGFAERMDQRYQERAFKKRIMVLRAPDRPIGAPASAPAKKAASPPPAPPPAPPKPAFPTYAVAPPAAPAGPPPRMVPFGPPVDPWAFEDGKRVGRLLADGYFDVRYDETLAVKFPK